jgi:hypothetical protein
MNCRILIVEDDAGMAESLKNTLQRELGEVEIIHVSDFAKAPNEIASREPDIVVLDIFDEIIEQPPKDSVRPAWDVVWDVHFCPVVFHSAQEYQPYKSLNHPFVRYEVKIGGSLGRVADHIKSFAPEIEGLRTVRQELSRSAGETLRDVGPLIWQSGNPTTEQTNLFLRVARRRMAAALDYTAAPEKQTQAWEQYIYPPIGGDLLTGDLIRVTTESQTEPSAYRVALSPSCDLVLGRGAKTLQHVLVADCVPVKDFLDKANIDSQKLSPSDLRRKLLSELNKDQVGGLAVMPELPKVLPLMAVDLKKLSLLPYADIAPKKDESKRYFRVASVDSPFRERLAWAYLQVAGRPGVPDVDQKALANSITQTIPPKTKA